MKPDAIIRTAKAAIDVLDLAAKEADGDWHWLQINRLASELVRELAQIEQDENLKGSLRLDAKQDLETLRSVMEVSCRKAEEAGCFGYLPAKGKVST